MPFIHKYKSSSGTSPCTISKRCFNFSRSYLFHADRLNISIQFSHMGNISAFTPTPLLKQICSQLTYTVKSYNLPAPLLNREI